MADEQRMVFHIPANFAEEGTVFGGRMKSRNAVETILFMILLLQPVFALRVSTKVKIYLAVLFVLPVCIFSIIGVQGESLSSFGMGAVYFFRTRRVWGPPDDGYRMERLWKEQRKAEKAMKSGGFLYGRKKSRQAGRSVQKGGGRNGFLKKAGEKRCRERRAETAQKTDIQGNGWRRENAGSRADGEKGSGTAK